MRSPNKLTTIPHYLIMKPVFRASFFFIVSLLVAVQFLGSPSLARRSAGPSRDAAVLASANSTAIQSAEARPDADLRQLLNSNGVLSPFYGPLIPPPTPESINTYQQNCTTLESHFSTGDTVCADAGGDLFGRRSIWWVDPNGEVVQRNTVDSNNRNAFRQVTQAGNWRVYLVDDSDGSARDFAAFSVSDPQRPTVDLSVFKSSSSDFNSGGVVNYRILAVNNGPDDAAAVQLVEVTPNNATYLSSAQDSGPTFTCTPGTGSTTCTIATLPAGSSASFTFFYTLDAGLPAGTIISNNARITSSTEELHSQDNNWTDTHSISGNGGAGTCTVSCPEDISVAANTTENNQPGAVVHFTAPVGNTECGVITVDHCNACFFPQGTTIVTGTATTGESCSFRVIVTAPAPGAPTISCPANQTANADSNCAAMLTVGSPTVTGNNVTFSGVRSDGQPMYNCDCFANPDDVCDIHGACTRKADAAFSAGITTITWTAYSHDSAGPYPDAATEEAHRTGSASCTQTITVNDVTPPVITPPPGQTVSADANCQAAVPDFTQTTTVTDNCSCAASDTSETCQGRQRITVTQDPAPGTIEGRGTYTITLTANDGSSNPNPGPDGIPNTSDDGTGNISTATTTFTVRDTTAPTITCPADISIPNTPGTCNASVSPGVATATDNCDGTVTPTPSRSDGKPLTDPFPVGTVTIHWTATDSSNNSSSCDQTVVVLDNENPTITCPANITTNTDPGTCSANVNPGTATATDNCGSGHPPTVTGTRSDNQPLNAPYPKGTTTIHWTATDSSGNSASCDQTVTVNDNENPAITCPANITRSTDPGTCSASIDPGTPTATDNCGTPTVTGTRSDSQPLSAPYPKGTTTIHWTATDSSGNSSSCDQAITVNDTEPPAITCPANITASTEPGTCAAHVVPGTATATDNCGTTTVTGTRSDGRPLTDTYPRGTTTITWTATDSSGNQSSCAQAITVSDTEAPTITFNGQTPSMWPPNHTYHTFTSANFISSVSDNCDSLSVSDVYITKVTSDEAETAGGSGNTLNDIVISGDCKSIQLRAERINTGNGRVYTIYFKLKDSSGNFTTGTAKVYSPKNEGETPGDDGPHYTVTSSCP